MRSPWQLIKGLTSRRVTDTPASADEASANPDPSAEYLREAAKPGTMAVPDPNAPSANPTNIETAIEPEAQQAGAAPELPPPVTQTEHPNSLSLRDIAADTGESALPIEPQVFEAENTVAPHADVVDRQKLQSRAAQAPLGKSSSEAPKVRAVEPVSTLDTAIENASMLEAEIQSLRHQLSSKLVEQNKYLREMLARYDS